MGMVGGRLNLDRTVAEWEVLSRCEVKCLPRLKPPKLQLLEARSTAGATSDRVPHAPGKLIHT